MPRIITAKKELTGQVTDSLKTAVTYLQRSTIRVDAFHEECADFSSPIEDGDISIGIIKVMKIPWGDEGGTALAVEITATQGGVEKTIADDNWIVLVNPTVYVPDGTFYKKMHSMPADEEGDPDITWEVDKPNMKEDVAASFNRYILRVVKELLGVA